MVVTTADKKQSRSSLPRPRLSSVYRETRRSLAASCELCEAVIVSFAGLNFVVYLTGETAGMIVIGLDSNLRNSRQKATAIGDVLPYLGGEIYRSVQTGPQSQWRTQEFCSREGTTNSVEDRGQRERGSGGGSPIVRGSRGSCNLVQEISFHIVKFFLIFGTLRLFMMTTNLFVIANVKQLRT